MAYRFRLGDRTVKRAVHRIACEQIDGALAAIAGKPRDKAIHEVRKACKKLRALLRLVRPGFPGYTYENTAFRDIARLLAFTRDARVMLDTFDLLLAGAPEDFDRAQALFLRAHFAQALEQPGVEDAADARLEEVCGLLRLARERALGWTLEQEGWDALGPGLGKVLDQADRARRAVARNPGAAQYHELRKRMKYYWYHTRLLEPVWPALMKPRAAELSRLADLLGLHHDICMFEQRLETCLPGSRYGHSAAALRGLAADRRKQLERDTAPAVAKLLAQETEALMDHWGRLWAVWRAGGKPAA